MTITAIQVRAAETPGIVSIENGSIVVRPELRYRLIRETTDEYGVEIKALARWQKKPNPKWRTKR